MPNTPTATSFSGFDEFYSSHDAHMYVCVFSLFRATIIQHQSSRKGQAQKGSVALPAVLRAGDPAHNQFSTGSMQKAQTARMSNTSHSGHVQPAVSVVFVSSALLAFYVISVTVIFHIMLIEHILCFITYWPDFVLISDFICNTIKISRCSSLYLTRMYIVGLHAVFVFINFSFTGVSLTFQLNCATYLYTMSPNCFLVFGVLCQLKT